MKRTLALTILLAAPVFAQQTLVESVEVRVTNVDVVVTGRDGKPVVGLIKDDFEVFENRQRQTITNLYEVRPEELVALEQRTESATTPAEAPPPEMRTRRVIIFIDNYTIHPVKRNQVFDSVDRAIDQLLRPGDEAMLVTWYRGSRVAMRFTSDHAALRKALAEQRKKGGGGQTLLAEKSRIKSAAASRADTARQFPNRYPMGRAYQESLAEVSVFAETTMLTAKQLYGDLNAVLSTLAGVEGKKVMLYAGGDLPENPGMELYQYVVQLFGPLMKNNNDDRTQSGLSRNLSHLLRGIANKANADGVTVYMIDAGERSVLGTAESATIEPPASAFTEEANTMMAMNLVASMTGGAALSGTRNFDVVLDTISRDLDSYYSLGYRSTNEKEGDQRVIVVKAKNPAYRIRARSSYIAKSAEEQMSDRVIAGVFHSNLKSELPIAVTAGAPEKFTGGQFKVPITVTLPSTITTIPDGAQMAGSFSVYFVVGNERGDLSNVARKTQSVRFPAVVEKAVRATPFTYTASLVMRPGENIISVGVVDDLAGTYGVTTATVLAR